MSPVLSATGFAGSLGWIWEKNREKQALTPLPLHHSWLFSHRVAQPWPSLSKRSQSSEEHTCIIPRDDVTGAMAETQTRCLWRKAFGKAPRSWVMWQEGWDSNRQVGKHLQKKTAGWTQACRWTESASGWESEWGLLEGCSRRWGWESGVSGLDGPGHHARVPHCVP